jgi:large subunit ribosomal protein L25
MPEVVELQLRDAKGTKAAKALRNKSLVPGVIYGDQIQSRHFSIASNQMTKLLRSFGTSTLFDVKVGDEEKPVKVIVQDVARDPVTDQFKHVDFYQVRMDKKLHTEIPLEFTGESLAVKDLGGTLTKQIDDLPIECLPENLIPNLEVPIETLATFEDVIRVSDLKLPRGVATNLDPASIVASVIAPRTDEELAALEEEVKTDVEGVEVEGEKEEEGEEGEEGEKTTADDADSVEGAEEAKGSEGKLEEKKE